MTRVRESGAIGARELLINVAVIVALPLVLRFAAPITTPMLFMLGFGDLLSHLVGGPGTTDIGWGVAASRGLIESGVSAYAPVSTLGPLIGMEAWENQAHSHPPTSLFLLVPLALAPYSWWLGFWVVAMGSVSALSMRLMGVAAWVAYPVTVGLVLTRVGQNTLTGSYPIVALAVALAWRYRDRTWIPGLSYALIAASRGIGGLLLIYPLVRRRWKVVGIALGTLVALGTVAIILEPNVIGGFLEGGRASIEYNMTRPLLTPYGLFEYVGLPGWLSWVAIAVVTAIALKRGQSLFWVSLWFTFAVTPIVWAQGYAMALPLAVVIWRSGRLGAVFVLLTGATLVAGTAGIVVVWPVGIALGALALLLCDLSEDSIDRQEPRPAAPVATTP